MRVVSPRTHRAQTTNFLQKTSRCDLLQRAKAEGTRFELATGYPAPHFQCEAETPESLGKQHSARDVSANVQRENEKSVADDSDLATVIERWAELPAAIKAGIVAMVNAYEHTPKTNG